MSFQLSMSPSAEIGMFQPILCTSIDQSTFDRKIKPEIDIFKINSFHYASYSMFEKYKQGEDANQLMFLVVDITGNFKLSIGDRDYVGETAGDVFRQVAKQFLCTKILKFSNFKPGIIFKDLSAIMSDPFLFRCLVEVTAQDLMSLKIGAKKLSNTIDVGKLKFVGLDARGFIFGGALAFALNCGFVMARKKGKLPFSPENPNPSARYLTEYSSDEIEIMQGQIQPGDQVVAVDDLIATGGTFEGVTKVIEQMGGTVVAYCAILKVDVLFESAQRKLKDKEILVVLND